VLVIALIDLVLGTGLLLAGRKLFWLFVGTVGFGIGVELGSRIFQRGELFTVLVALATGLVFAAIAIFVESVAIGLAGFLGGGYMCWAVLRLVGYQGITGLWLVAVLGGIVGAAATVLSFDWALVGLSSLVGASLVAGGLRLTPDMRGVVFLGLLLLGAFVQGMALRRASAPSRRRTC
jgi:hypothetical protein